MSEEELSEEKKLSQIVQKAADDLGEFFESVRIFASRKTEDGESMTIGISKGCGNYYAQYGHVYNWLKQQEGITMAQAAKDANDE